MNTLIELMSLIAVLAFLTKVFLHISVDQKMKDIFSVNPFHAFNGYKFFLPLKKNKKNNCTKVNLSNFLLIVFYSLFVLVCVLIVAGRLHKYV